METMNTYYDEDLLRVMRNNALDSFCERPYYSNWRVLHIDNFEGWRRPLPINRGKMIQFFEYKLQESE